MLSASRDRRYHRQLYRTNPAYRQRAIDSARLRWEVKKKDPIERELKRLRCMIYSRRERIDQLMKKLDKRTAELVAMVDRKLELEKLRARRSMNGNGIDIHATVG